jgi:hypothetical protein
MYKMIKEVASELSIQEDWLNDGIKGFVYENVPYEEALEYSHLKIMQLQQSICWQ